MIEQMVFGIGLIALVFAWHYVWIPTSLDTARDGLFDIREQVRKDFIEKGWGLDHPIYKALRDLLNGHLRHTESLSLFRLGVMESEMQKHKEMDALVRKRIERFFATDQAEISAYVAEVRRQSGMIMFAYMVETSILAMTFAVLGIIVLSVRAIFRKGFRMIANGLTGHYSRAALVSSALFAAIGVAGHTRADAQAAMEECAFNGTRPT